MDLDRLRLIDPLAESDLKVEIRSGWIPEERVDATVISFRGTYRIGCKGGPDADLMRFIIAGTLAVETESSILILDLRELDYQWGDNMDEALSVNSGFPCGCRRGVAIILGPKCEPAIFTLLNGENPKPDATFPPRYVRDFDAAWRYAINSLISNHNKDCFRCSLREIFNPPDPQT